MKFPKCILSLVYTFYFHKLHFLFFVVVFLLKGCNGLDNDEAFIYSHQSTFLINNTNQLYRCILVADTMKLKFSLENIHNGSIVNDKVVFLDTLNKKLIIFSNPFEIATERNLNKSYYLVNGWKNFLVLSNFEESLLENHNKKSKENLILPQGSQYIFCNQGRVWLIQKRKVWVYDLNTGAPIDSFDLLRDFQFADFDRSFRLFVYTQDSTGLYQKYFDTNAISAGQETRVNFKKVQHTKVLTRLYETEYLKNIEQNAQNQLNISNFFEEVHSFDMDFQSSRLFFTRNDSLFVINLNLNKKQFLKANFGSIKKGLHFYSQN